MACVTRFAPMAAYGAVHAPAPRRPAALAAVGSRVGGRPLPISRASRISIGSSLNCKVLAVAVPDGALASHAGAPPPAPAPTPAVLPPPATFSAACSMSVAKASYPLGKTLILSFLAGAYIAIGGMLLTIVGGGAPGVAASNPGIQKFLVGAIGLPTALSMTVLTGCELFTGNTFIMTAGLLNERVTHGDLLKNWGLSYFGNLAGSVFMAILGFMAKAAAAAPFATTAMAVATMKCSTPFSVLFAKGILCNWLVCIAVWLAMTSQDATGKILGMFLPVSTFVAMGMEHSVANMFLIPQGIFLGAPVTWGQFLHGNLLPVTLGNIVGGAVFVAGAYHLAYGQR